MTRGLAFLGSGDIVASLPGRVMRWTGLHARKLNAVEHLRVATAFGRELAKGRSLSP